MRACVRLPVLMLMMLGGATSLRCVTLLPQHKTAGLLDPESFHDYFVRFAEQERELLGDDPDDAWGWQVRNIPWLDVPDKELEEVYYFRWYSFKKHIRKTDAGYVITEFLDDVPWAGRYNTINPAAEHHLREARWLRDGTYAEQDARFWLSAAGEPRRYSLALAHAIYSVYLASGNKALATSLLPGLAANYTAWEKTHQDVNGLFWQIDDRDGMEDSIGGSGYRPTINSYQYGDAVALANIASMAGDLALAARFSTKAGTLRARVEADLWNPRDTFYETARRTPQSDLSGVRELIGYVPWYFDLPHADRVTAWRQLHDPQGFAGEYGPTTAERRSPRFRYDDPHECLWNGPSWPFATTQTLVALANVLNGPRQNIVRPEDYRRLLAEYVRSQHLRLGDGRSIPWVDEDLDADTGEWIARGILQKTGQPPPNRGRYYNHSGFADLIVTGLLGIRPAPGNTLVIHPLIEADKWAYFALDELPYHGHLLTVLYDRDGSRYKRGTGMQVFCDGKKIASRVMLSRLTVVLPAEHGDTRGWEPEHTVPASLAE